MNMDFYRKLAIPSEVKRQYPAADSVLATVARKRAELIDIFEGRSDRLVLIIGPCSADNEDAVMRELLFPFRRMRPGLQRSCPPA